MVDQREVRQPPEELFYYFHSRYNPVQFFTIISMLIHLGANLTVVADLIGDTLQQVTKTYAHLYEEDKQKIIAQIQ
ncbi:MAG: hypothetical protein IJD77_07010 [Clostridia bacterium]|nr:hypothetical protein [Clostridia bacterium]